jgi:multimeric flavodoxin WrbA
VKSPVIRKHQGSVDLSQAEFKRRAALQFQGPEFEKQSWAVHDIVALQWKRYDESEKVPFTRPAGKGFKWPRMEVPAEWVETRAMLEKAKQEHDRKGAKPRFLVINGSPRSDNTCPGEMSKTHRLCETAMRKFKREKCEIEYLDLSRVTSEFGKSIHPCKGCVSTAMPLCHWPCSCYPNHALGQIHDWMGEIYEMWMRAHGVMIITPVHWYSPPSVLKLMMDRLVCADGGNEDYTSTKGKDPKLAKEIEIKGWDFPRHLEGRIYSVVTHGDSEGVLQVKDSLSNWLQDMGLVSAGNQAVIDRYIGYYGTYAEGHEDLDKDQALHHEVSRAAELLHLEVKKILKNPLNKASTEGNRAVRKK